MQHDDNALMDKILNSLSQAHAVTVFLSDLLPEPKVIECV